jgi:hypothetical protein
MTLAIKNTAMTSQLSRPGRLLWRIMRALLLLALPVVVLLVVIWVAVSGLWRPLPQGELFRTTVQSYRQWQSTGFYLTPGNQVTIRAQGQWLYSPTVGKHGPAGGEPAPAYYPMPGERGGALIGKIGENGSPFFVGPYMTLYVPEAGLLYLRINDDLLGDNVGELDLEIIIPKMTATPQ